MVCRSPCLMAINWFSLVLKLVLCDLGFRIAIKFFDKIMLTPLTFWNASLICAFVSLDAWSEGSLMKEAPFLVLGGNSLEVAYLKHSIIVVLPDPFVPTISVRGFPNWIVSCDWSLKDRIPEIESLYMDDINKWGRKCCVWICRCGIELQEKALFMYAEDFRNVWIAKDCGGISNVSFSDRQGEAWNFEVGCLMFSGDRMSHSSGGMRQNFSWHFFFLFLFFLYKVEAFQREERKWTLSGKRYTPCSYRVWHCNISYPFS